MATTVTARTPRTTGGGVTFEQRQHILTDRKALIILYYDLKNNASKKKPCALRILFP